MQGLYWILCCRGIIDYATTLLLSGCGSMFLQLKYNLGPFKVASGDIWVGRRLVQCTMKTLTAFLMANIQY